MAELNNWNITAANNNDAPPDGWPESTMQYSEVNDAAREGMAVIARFFKDTNGSLQLGGLVNAYTLTLNAGYTAYFAGMYFAAEVNIENTGAATLNVNGLGIQSIVDRAGKALGAGDLQAGGIYEFRYDGTNFQLMGETSGGSIVAASIRVTTDIVTATPPTTEAVTGGYAIYDLDNTDLLSELSYIGSNNLQLINRMHGGAVILSGEDNSGALRQLVNADPDGSAFLYYQGSGKIGSVSAGIAVFANGPAADPPTSEALVGSLQFMDSDFTTNLGWLGFNAGPNMQFRNQYHGGHVQLLGETSAGVSATLFLGDPDGSTSLYYTGVEILRTGSGLVQLRSVGNTDAENRYVLLGHQDGTARGIVGHTGGDALRVNNQIHGGNVQLDAEDIGGITRTILDGNPDANLDLFYPGAGNLRTRMGADGAVTLYSDGSTDAENRRINLAHADGTVRGVVGHTGGDTLRVNNQIHGGNVQLDAEDSGGITRTILVGDPDATTTLRADTDLILQVAAGETAFNATANGAASLYYDNVQKFRSALETAADQISGAEVAGADGTFQPVGLGTIIDDPTAFGSGTVTPFQQINAQQTIEHNEAVATNYDTYASTGASQTNIPAGAQWEVKNTGTGALTIRAGTFVTLTWFDGSGAAPPTGNRTLARGGRCVVRKISDTSYEIWGVGLS